MEYKVCTYMMVGEDEKKAPGDYVSTEELEAYGQTEEDIEKLLESGAISEDLDAEVDEAHRPVERMLPEDNGLGDVRHVLAEEEGKGV